MSNTQEFLQSSLAPNEALLIPTNPTDSPTPEYLIQKDMVKPFDISISDINILAENPFLQDKDAEKLCQVEISPKTKLPINSTNILESSREIYLFKDLNPEIDKSQVKAYNPLEIWFFKLSVSLTVDDLNKVAPLQYLEDGIFKKFTMKSIDNYLELNRTVIAHNKIIRYLANPEYAAYLNLHYHSLMSLIKENLANKICLSSKTLIAEGKALVYQTEQWCYYKFFYKLLKQTVKYFDKETIDLFFTRKIIFAVVNRLSSEIPDERKEIVEILIAIYQKSKRQKNYILQKLKNLFLSIICGEESINACFELLNLFQNIIKSQDTPNNYLYTFANEVLLPLHKVQSIILFHEQLKQVCIECSKESEDFANNWISSLIRWWPFGNSAKELLFLDELETGLQISEAFISEKAASLAFIKLSKILASEHDAVSLKSFKIMLKESSKNIILKYSENLCKKMYKGILEATKKKENKKFKYYYMSIKDFVLGNILKNKYSEALKFIFTKQSSLATMHSLKERENQEKKWEILLNRAKEINPNFKCPIVPYSGMHVVGLVNMNKTSLNSGNLIPSVYLY